MTSSAVLPRPHSCNSHEQESPVITYVALALTGGLYVLAVGILVGGIMGWHSLPFASPQMARAYYGLDLVDPLRPQLAQAAPPAHR